MKQAMFGIVLVVAGMVAGALLPGVEAQDAPPGPARFEQVCELKGGLGSGEGRAAAVGRFNASLASRAAEGWTLVSTPTFTQGNGGQVYTELMLCYTRRVAP